MFEQGLFDPVVKPLGIEAVTLKVKVMILLCTNSLGALNVSKKGVTN